MKAVFVEGFGDPSGLVVREAGDPRPAEGQILVDVAAVSVNFPDVLVAAGTYQILPDLPFVPGKEVAGTVAAIGSGVDDFAVGDRVAAQLENGGYADSVVVAAEQAVRVPDGVDLDVAATVGLPYATAYYALKHRAGVRPGETVLVTGATGAVGSASIQLSKVFGATVIATASDEAGAQAVTRQGADHVVSSAPETLRDEVRALTDGDGVDVVIETIGGETFAEGVRCVGWEGRLVVAGFASGTVPLVNAGHVLVKNISVTGLQVSDYRDRDPRAFSAVIGQVLDLIADGRIHVDIAARYSLDEAAQALDLVASRAVRGRIILNP